MTDLKKTDLAIRPGPRNLITDVAGIQVGNAADTTVRTGVTVVLPTERAIAVADVRGGAPGTRETDALRPEGLVDAVDAVVLAGGSVYGLEAASAVTNWLGAHDRGYELAPGLRKAPIVPAAILFDLANGGAKDWDHTSPYGALGITACEAASETFDLGNVGAGYGAVAGSLKGGLGSVSAVMETAGSKEPLQVGALIAANPFGSTIVPGTSVFWAALMEQDGELGGQSLSELSAQSIGQDPWAGTKAQGLAKPGTNTTIGVIATNARLTAVEAQRVATMAHDGLARAVRPVHAPVDGDTLFVLATGAREAGEPSPIDVALIGMLAADCATRALARGVYAADSLGQVKSYKETFDR